MSYSPAKVTIDLQEYHSLLEKQKIADGLVEVQKNSTKPHEKAIEAIIFDMAEKISYNSSIGQRTSRVDSLYESCQYMSKVLNNRGIALYTKLLDPGGNKLSIHCEMIPKT